MDPIPQWQYHVETLSSLHPDYVKHCLNQFGWQGWELVSIEWFPSNIQGPIAIFKRPYVKLSSGAPSAPVSG